MTTFILKWQHTESEQRAAFLADGTRLGVETVEVADAALSPEGRAMMLEARADSCGLETARNSVPARDTYTAFHQKMLTIDCGARETAPGVAEVEAALAASIEWTRGAVARREANLAAEAAEKAAKLAEGIAAVGPDVEAYVRGLATDVSLQHPTLAYPLTGLTVPDELRERVTAAAKVERERRQAEATERALAIPRRLAALLCELDLADERCRAPHADAEKPLGLWTEQEAREAVRDRILPREVGETTSGVVRARISWVGSDVPHLAECEGGEYCECGKASFTAPVAESLSADEYRAVRRAVSALRAGLPLVPGGNDLHTEAVWDHVYRHRGERAALDDADALSELEVTVSVDLGDWVLVDREYLIDVE